MTTYTNNLLKLDQGRTPLIPPEREAEFLQIWDEFQELLIIVAGKSRNLNSNPNQLALNLKDWTPCYKSLYEQIESSFNLAIEILNLHVPVFDAESEHNHFSFVAALGKYTNPRNWRPYISYYNSVKYSKHQHLLSPDALKQFTTVDLPSLVNIYKEFLGKVVEKGREKFIVKGSLFDELDELERGGGQESVQNTTQNNNAAPQSPMQYQQPALNRSGGQFKSRGDQLDRVVVNGVIVNGSGHIFAPLSDFKF
eukprot:TRINITY_DN22906_c0_g1_i1.p1 TRINITY_DN22906_c0_g1~~TRINITY_DN22906_c0_g1_i1.p1  ORF type:complete len:253 (-),score=54.49 TRINITY_DN22906_c0_g1_i1:47-805(-)